MALAALQLLLTFPLSAQTTYTCLPTCSEIDGRFLSLGGSRYNTLAGDEIAITLAAPRGSDTISFEIFDGETGGVWDAGTAPLTFKLYADPTGDGTGTRKVGEWSGASMRDTSWYRIAMAHDTTARSESGRYFYSLKVRIAWGDDSDSNDIEDDTEDVSAASTWSNFKIRSDANMVTTRQFAFCAPLFSMREGNIIYPNYPFLTNSTFDGTFSLFVQVPARIDTMEIWDGDMDFGSYDGRSMDDDDPNTPNDTLPTWSGVSAVREGVGRGTDLIRSLLGLLTGRYGTGAPMDDNLSAAYRRAPAVYYEVIDPNGKRYRNDNPSGNLEWERFLIGTTGLNSRVDTATIDLPRGVYEIRISGMDLQNLNSWRYSEGVVGVTADGTAQLMPRAECPTNPVARLAVGPVSEHAMMLTEEGHAYLWGDNDRGQLGNGTQTDRTAPGQAVKGDYDGDEFLGDDCNGAMGGANGEFHSLAVMHDGTVFAWGRNNQGQLGLGSSDPNEVHEPTKVTKGEYSGTSYLGDDPLNPIEKVAAGREHSLAISAKGLVYGWGRNVKGALGDGSERDRSAPVRARKGEYPGTTFLGDRPGNPIIDIATSDRFSIALAADGTVYTWGLNNKGQLGNASTRDSETPVRVRKGAYAGTTYLGDNPANKIIAISAMAAGGLALAADGTVYAWGWNHDGQLGDGTSTDRTSPVRVRKGAYAGTTYLGDNASNRVRAISSGGAQDGGSHSLALTANGEVYAWGSNNRNQLGDGTSTDRSTPIRVLKGEYEGNTYLGDSTVRIGAISCGYDQSYATAVTGGQTYGWGDASKGSLGDGTDDDASTPVLVAQGDRMNKGVVVESAPTSEPEDELSAVTIDRIALDRDGNEVSMTLDAATVVELSIDLFSSDGDHISRPLESRRFADGEQRIGIAIPADLASGVYFLKFTTQFGSTTKHFVLTR